MAPAPNASAETANVKPVSTNGSTTQLPVQSSSNNTVDNKTGTVNITFTTNNGNRTAAGPVQ